MRVAGGADTAVGGKRLPLSPSLVVPAIWVKMANMVGVVRLCVAAKVLCVLVASAGLLSLAACAQPAPVVQTPPARATASVVAQAESPLLPRPTPPRFNPAPRAGTPAEPDATAGVIALPTVTPTPTRVEQPPLAITETTTETGVTETVVTVSALPSPTLAAEIFAAQGIFTVTRPTADGDTFDTGGFALIRSPAENRRGYNEFYRLAVNSSNRRMAAIAVYVVDDAVAVNLGQDQWLIMPYRPDSPFVAAVQAMHRLPVALLPLLAQAGPPQRVELGGRPTQYYRLTQPGLLALLLPDLPAAGAATPASETAGLWLSDPNGEVVRLELEATNNPEAPVADAAIPAPSALSLVYEVVPESDSLRPVIWPEGAPPAQLQMPGFAEDTFPMPPGAVRVYPAEGSLDLIVDAPEAEVVDYYRARLAELGWSFTGEQGVYHAANPAVSDRAAGAEGAFDLLIGADPARNATRVVVMPPS